MITMSYPSLRPKLASYGGSYGYQGQQQSRGVFVMGLRKPDLKDLNLADKRKVTGEEIVRRDQIVRDLWIACKVNAGDYVMPKTEGDRNKYGQRLHVRGIYRTYHDFPLHETWPADDIPYIVVLDTKEGAILCTSDFFVKAANGRTC